MPRPFQHSAKQDVPTDKVHAAFVTEQYWRDRVADIGGPGAELKSVTTGDGTIEVVLTQSVPASELPAAVTAFKPGDLIIVRTESWGPLGGERSNGLFSATVDGAPARLEGTLVLNTDGSGSVITMDGTAEVKVPLIGGRIEAMVIEQVLRLIDNEHSYTSEWIGRHG